MRRRYPQQQRTIRQVAIDTLNAQVVEVQLNSVTAMAFNLNMVNVPDPNNDLISCRSARSENINVQSGSGSDGPIHARWCAT